MSLVVKNDEQIKVGTTPGLVAGASSFTFDGTSGKPDYRLYELTVFEYGGRSPMIKGLDYSWNYTTGLFTLLLAETFTNNQWYTIQFKIIPNVTPVSPASIVDWSFFIRNINIPNLSLATGNAANVQKINLFIEQREPECLEKLLGYSLYSLFLTENTQRIDDIIYGAEYTDNCSVLQKWKGLVYGNKISLLANYIYFYIQESDAKFKTGVNTTIPKGATLIPSSPEEQMIEAWRFFSKESKSLISFLWNKKSSDTRVYPEFTSQQYNIVNNAFRPVNTFDL